MNFRASYTSIRSGILSMSDRAYCRIEMEYFTRLQEYSSVRRLGKRVIGDFVLSAVVA